MLMWNTLIIVSLLWSDQVLKNVRKPPGRSPGIAGEANNYCRSNCVGNAREVLNNIFKIWFGSTIMNFYQIPIGIYLYVDTLIPVTVKGKAFFGEFS